MRRYLYSQPDNAVLYDLGLTQTQYRLYNIMVDRMNKKTRQLTINVRDLAKLLGRSMITTSRHLSAMDAKKVIIRIFNKSKSNPKVNDASTFIICGRLAKRYEGSEYTGDYPCIEDQKRQYPTVKNDGEKDLEESSKRENLKDTLKREALLPISLSNTDQTPEPSTSSNQEKAYDLSDVPDIMRHAVLHLLRETGRTSIRPKELEPLRVLSQKHTPERVMKEIDTCIERFKRNGKRIDGLNFCYIAACLGNQRSYNPEAPKKKRTHRNKEAVNPAVETVPIQESVPEISSEILPVAEAERVISEYTPDVKVNGDIPAALEELYAEIQAKDEEIAGQYLDAKYPKDEYGAYIFPDGEEDDEDLPEMTLEEYLRLKYPEAEEEELRTDRVHDKRGLQQAFEIDRKCAYCETPENCPFDRKRGRPVVMLKRHRLEVGYTTCMSCKHDKSKPDPEIERRVKQSGLSESQSRQTFSAYNHTDMPAEIVSAKAKAILAAKKHTSLILAGKPGTGKTHLATAIALEVMRGGKQALFRTVPDMLDELWIADWNHTDFFSLRQKYREVPCLVLDDWGKEKPTEKKLEYLYQIIDYRYKHGLQTVVTTNALDIGGLMRHSNADKIEPLVSRILEKGEWVTIRNAENHRLTKRAEPEEPKKSECTPSLGLDDEDLWKEDENEYALPGDWRYRKPSSD